MKSDPPQPALPPQPARHGLEPATRNLKPVTCNLFHTQVFENKITAQLPLSNQMDTRQSNLSTTVSKQSLVQWNQILKCSGAQSFIFEKTHISRSPEPASPGNQLQAPAPSSTLHALNSQLPTPSSQLPAISSQLSAPSYQLSAISYQSENKIAAQLLL
jgi:hypothetical protein